MSTDRRTRAWIEVEASSVRRNLRRIRDAIPGTSAVIPIVKADAYGLGVAGALQALAGEELWGFGVATVEEGRELRSLGFEGRVLVVAPVAPGAVRDGVEADLVLAISSPGVLTLLEEEAVRAGREVVFQTEVDTGMGRAGLDWRRAKEWGPVVARHARGPLRWGGCFTHFHSAELTDTTSVRTQWQRFEDALRVLPRPDGDFVVHACSGAAALRVPDLSADAVRPGLFLFGGAAAPDLPAPEPVMQVRARVVLVRDAPPGTTVGYGATHAARRWERWATAAIGYGDGLSRMLGNRGHALVRGRRVPIIGRISMDMTVVDITDVNGVEPGDVVTFIGRDGDENITLEEVAELASTISYEILTGFTRRLPRIWIDEGEAP